MKKSNLYHVLGLMILFAVILGCNSDEPEDILPDEPEPPVNVEIVNWEKIESVEQRIINAKNFGNKVHAIGASDIFLDVFQGDQTQPVSIRPFLTRIGRYMPPFNRDFLVSRTETEIFVFSLNDFDENKALRISGVELDENFNSFEDIPLWNGELLGLTNTNHVLIPFRNVINGIAQDNPSFAILEVALENGEIELKNKIIVDERIFFSFNTCNRIQSFSNFFMALIGPRVFKITTEGEITEVFPNNNVVFEFGQELKTFELDRAANEFLLKRNAGDGVNWTNIGRFPNLPALRTARFTSVFGKIIGFDGLDIFEIEIVGGELKLKYLQSNNLEGGTITSIIEYDDNVLITTTCNNPSTNCGIFIKDRQDFFLPKP